jgi:hypothetical protein
LFFLIFYQASQIECFLNNPKEREMVMPPGLTSDEVEVTRRIAEQRGLKLVEVEKPRKQLKIVKN